MRRWITLLTVIFIIQLGLSIYSQLDVGQASSHQGLWLNIDDSKPLTAIHITDQAGSELVIRQQGERWVLPHYSNIPVETSAVERLLAELKTAKKGWPVAASVSAAERFSVATKDYKRKLTLKSGEDEISAFYLGTSPSFRKIHGRLAGDETIYAIRITPHHASVDIKHWLDKTLLYLGPDLNRVSVTTKLSEQFSLVKSGDMWTLEDPKSNGAGSDEIANQRIIKQFISGIGAVSVTGLWQGREQQPVDTLPPAVTLSVNSSTANDGINTSNHNISNHNDENPSLRLYQYDGYYLIKSSHYPYYFELPKARFELLTQADREHFLKPSQSD